MHLCLDIDDTITYAPGFFRQIQSAFDKAQTTIVSFRTDLDSTADYLESERILYDQLILSTHPELGKSADQSLSQWKAELVNSLRPDIFFEDMPEVVGLIDPEIVVFMPCDNVIREWIRQKT